MENRIELGIWKKYKKKHKMQNAHTFSKSAQRKKQRIKNRKKRRIQNKIK